MWKIQYNPKKLLFLFCINSSFFWDGGKILQKILQSVLSQIISGGKYFFCQITSYIFSIIYSKVSYSHKKLGYIYRLGSNVQNISLLKIHLNLFEISNRVLKFENISKGKVFSCLKIYFKYGPCGVVPFACFQVKYMIRLNTLTLHGSPRARFESNFQAG